MRHHGLYIKKSGARREKGPRGVGVAAAAPADDRVRVERGRGRKMHAHGHGGKEAREKTLQRPPKGQANPVTGPAARSDAAGRMGDGWLAGSAYSFPVKWTGGTEY